MCEYVCEAREYVCEAGGPTVVVNWVCELTAEFMLLIQM